MTELLAVAWVSRLPMGIIKRLGQRYGVDPFLIAAICMTESSGRQYVTKLEENYRWLYEPEACAKKFKCSLEDEITGQSTSYGLMQIMGAVMREYGFKDSFDKAFEPETNVDYGTKHLAKFLKKYQRLESAISAYNAGSPRHRPDTTQYENQKYVDTVMGYWAQASGVQKTNA